MGDVSRSSSHPVVCAPTLLRPLLQPPPSKPDPHLCSSRRSHALEQLPALAAPLLPIPWLLLSVAAVSLWGRQLCSLSPKPQLSPAVGWFWGWWEARGPDPTPRASSCSHTGDCVYCCALPAPRSVRAWHGRVPGWLLGCSGVCLGWELFTGEDVAAQSPKCCRAGHGAMTRADPVAEANGCPRPCCPMAEPCRCFGFQYLVPSVRDAELCFGGAISFSGGVQHPHWEGLSEQHSLAQGHRGLQPVSSRLLSEGTVGLWQPGSCTVPVGQAGRACGHPCHPSQGCAAPCCGGWRSDQLVLGARHGHILGWPSTLREVWKAVDRAVSLHPPCGFSGRFNQN